MSYSQANRRCWPPRRQPPRSRSPDAFSDWNFISSLGAYVFAAGMAILFANTIFAFVRKAPAPANPWGQGATTLEWTLPSPPPFHQFDTLPRVVGPSPRQLEP